MEKDLGIPVLSIVRLKHLVSYVRDAANAQSSSTTTTAAAGGADEVPLLTRVETYRAQYGVDY